MQAPGRQAPGAPLSIGLFSPSWPPGAVSNGVVTYVGVMAAQLQSQRHPVTVLAGSVKQGDSGVPVYNLDGAWFGKTWAERRLQSFLGHAYPPAAAAQANRLAARVICRVVRERKIDVLEMEESLGMAYWFQRALRIPLVVRLHGPWFLNAPALGVVEDEAFHRRVANERRAIAAAAGVTAPSRDVLERVRRRYGLELPHAAVIPNPSTPVPPGELWTLPGCDRRRVLFVGRFDRHKGGDLMLDAFARVWRAEPEARLTFVGPDRGFRDDAGRLWSLPEYVRERLPDAAQAGALELLGEQPHTVIGELRRRALVTAVCSRYENFSYTTLEALAAGCPTVAAAVGGLPELVQDGVNGLLHRGGDAEHLAARILELLRDPERAARLGEAALRASGRYHPAVLAGEAVDFYATLAPPAGAGPVTRPAP